MAKSYVPPPDVLALLLELWEFGSKGSSYVGRLHRARMRALEASGLVVWVVESPYQKTLLLTDAGRLFLLQGGHLPDPSEQWAQMRAIHACLSKIIALHHGWRLEVAPHLPHPWRYVVELAEAGARRDYKRLDLRGAIGLAQEACDSIARCKTPEAWSYAVALRRQLDEELGRPITEAQRASWRHGTDRLSLAEAEALPAPLCAPADAGAGLGEALEAPKAAKKSAPEEI